MWSPQFECVVGEDGEATHRVGRAQKAGLPPRTGPHVLRHFYASALIRHGESVKVVQERLGHASASETLDAHSHLWPDSEDRTRAAVSQALAGLSSVGGSAAER